MIVLPSYGEPSRTSPSQLVDPSDASRPARALINIGQEIRQLSPVAQGIADDITAAETSATLSAAKRSLAERQAAFEQSLATDHNASGYGTRLESEVIAPAYQLITPELSPLAQRQLRETIDGWASDLRIGTGRTAQLKAIGRAKDELALTREAFLDSNQLDPYLEHLAGQAWLSPEERALEETHARRLFHDRQVEADIMDDPAAYLERPIDSGDPAKDRARLGLARTELRRQTADLTDQAIDLIVTDKLGTADDLERLFPDLRPGARAELADFLERHAAGKAERARRDPATQHQLAGEVSSLINRYDPTLEGFDSDYVAIATRISELPPGPLRDELNRNLKTIRTDAYEAVDTNEEAAFKALDQAFEDGRFGAISRKEDVRPYIDAGLLADGKKLRTLGFSTDQAKAIADLADKPDTQAREFRRLWYQRAEADNALTDTAIFPIAEAYATRQYTIDRATDTDRQTALQAYGQAKADLASWLSANPEAARDASKVNAKVHELGIRADVRKLKESTLPKLPSSTSMNLPGPLAPYAPAFQQFGRLYGVDPRFLAAIAMFETGRGTSDAFRSKRNAMGISDANGPVAMDSVEKSIERMARVLSSRTGPYRNARTLEDIGAIYAPPGAGNDPNGTNAQWPAGVASMLRELGVTDPKSLKLR